MTRFALIIWAYQETGSATTLALLGFFAWLPYVIVSPFAGVWVDRLDRRWVLILADFGSALMTLLLGYFFWRGELAVWHIFLLEGVTAVFDAFQSPAATVVTSVVLNKQDYPRANGLNSLARDASRILAPMAGGALLIWIGVGGILLIDVFTFLVAVFSLAIVPLPAALHQLRGEEHEPFLQQLAFGFSYIFSRKGLLGMMLIYMGIEFFAALTYFSVMPALILERSNGSEVALGLVQATLGGAGVVGALIISIWGLPKRRTHAVFGFTALSFLLGDGLFAIGQSLPVWLLAATVAAFFIPFISGADRTIWQSKVPPAMQGRVFSVSGMFRNGVKPIGYLLAGPLADRIFEPALQVGGAWVPYLGWLVGTGPGAGIGAMFLFTAVAGAIVSASGYLFRATRHVEDDLPDHDEAGKIVTMHPLPVPAQET
jgi:MFS family permease